MKPICQSIAAALAALSVVVTPGVARSASLARPWTLDDAVERAELVTIGEVVAVTFRESAAGDEAYLVAPHTFVTYRIDEVLHGTFVGDHLTLRLAGGFAPSTGRIMVVPHAPLFKPGDRDVLFVAGNGSSACPLVGCGLGRFRVVGDSVFANNGLAIRFDRAGRLRAGPDALPDREIAMTVPPAPAARLDELKARIQQGSYGSPDERQRLRRRLEALSQPRTIGVARRRHAHGAVPADPPIDLAAFRSLIASLASRYPAPAAPVATLSADAPFIVLAPRATQTTRGGRPAQPRELTLEQRFLRRNGGNPVLRSVQ